MNFKSIKAALLSLVVSALFSSCLPQQRITYFQQKDATRDAYPVDTTYHAIIQTNDILTIYVASLSAETASYFNFSDKVDDVNSLANGYIVDFQGNIQMPLVGNVHVANLTTRAARDTVIKRLEKYLVNPSVKLNIRNFRVTVLGEVLRPGVYPVQNEKLTITEALGLAGDLTQYGYRENVMVVRESNGRKEFGLVDLTSRELFISPYYNLHANDVVYVEPNKRKRFLVENWYRVVPAIAASVSAMYIVFQLSRGK